ncbi:hypothetical protein BDQ12DRAFT_671836 [Crucibulum laeve]|uniref:ABC transporter domain-containing protein n=1 Tax=Crucibulum laeve TaxID=68775 RepID=A0A5C3LFI4_9AGAR|nr:hypothetical protein BDQ12DRAFT_671836 [Crucibulum laeve]
MCISQFIVLAKSKFAIVALVSLSSTPITPHSAPIVTTPSTTRFSFTTTIQPKPRTVRKITPAKCTGEFTLHSVTFAYASRPTLPILKDVSSSSPCTKRHSSSAPPARASPPLHSVMLDEQDMKGHVASVGQRMQGGVVIFDGKSIIRTCTDEAISALDATSHTLRFKALKRWHANKITLVITHNLSQISPSNFVYVLKQGRIVEQGYRYDLESPPFSSSSSSASDEDEDIGELRKTMNVQVETGGFLPEKLIRTDEDEVQKVLEVEEGRKEEIDNYTLKSAGLPPYLKHQSIAIRPLTLGNWMLDVVADLTAGSRSTTVVPAPAVVAAKDSYRVSQFVPTQEENEDQELAARKRRPSSIRIPSLIVPTPSAAYIISSRRFGLQLTPTSPSFTIAHRSTTLLIDDDEERTSSIMKKGAVSEGQQQHGSYDVGRHAHAVPMTSVKVNSSANKSSAGKGAQEEGEADEQRPAFWALMRAVYPTILSFSKFRLVRKTAQSSTALAGSSLASQHPTVCSLDSSISRWRRVDKKWFDKKWFDKSVNSHARLVQILVKDGDDARNLISSVWDSVWLLLRCWALDSPGRSSADGSSLLHASSLNARLRISALEKRLPEVTASIVASFVVHPIISVIMIHKRKSSQSIVVYHPSIQHHTNYEPTISLEHE